MSHADPAQGQIAEERSEQDLSTLLDESQTAEVILLIIRITKTMRRILVDNFDPKAGLDQRFVPDDNLTSDEKLMAADLTKGSVEDYDRQRKLKLAYEKDLSTQKMQHLKRDSLAMFDQWQKQITKRIDEVVSNEKKSGTQPRRRQATSAPSDVLRPIGIKANRLENNLSKIRFKDIYPPLETSLTKLSMDERRLVLHAVLLLVLSLEKYSSFSRVMLLLLTSSLKLPLRTLEQDEYATAKGLLESVKELTAESETQKKIETNKGVRRWRVGLATAAGAAIIGVAGGMAAPLVASGVGSIMGGIGLGTTSAASYLGSVAGSTYLVGGLFGAYGGRMTGQMMDNYAREIEDFEFLPVHNGNKTSENMKEGAQQAIDHDHKLRVTICVSGWLTEKEEVLKPWRVLGMGAEVFALKYELEALLKLGNAMDGLIQSATWAYAQKQMISQTVFADLAAAMWPVGLVKAARIIDNPFSVAKSRSEKAGEVLADAIINRAQGERPVTLIGYSMGAKLVFACLKSLARRKAFGLVENAVLMGSPTPSKANDWREPRAVVSGRLVNVYSENDYVLGFMYRTSSLQLGIAGLQAIEGLADVENIDVSDEVKGHQKYRYLIGSILKKIGFEDIDSAAVAEERELLEKIEAEEEKNSLKNQRKRLLQKESNDGRADETAKADQEAAEIESQVETKTQKSLVSRAVTYFSTAGTRSDSPMISKASNLARTSSQSKDMVISSVKDAGTSTRDSRHHTHAALPSPSHIGQSYPRPDDSTNADKVDKDTRKTTKYFTQKAAGYLPSIPKQMPSMPPMSSFSFSSLPDQKKQLSKSRLGPSIKISGKSVEIPGEQTNESVNPPVKNIQRLKDDQVSKEPSKGPQQNLKANKLDKAQQISSAEQAVVHEPGDNLSSATPASDTPIEEDLETDNQARKLDKASLQKGNKFKAKSDVKNSGEQSYTSLVASYIPSLRKNDTREEDDQENIRKADRPSANRNEQHVKTESMESDENDKLRRDSQQPLSYTAYAKSYLPSVPSWSVSRRRPPPKLHKKTGGSGSNRGTPQTKSPPKLEERTGSKPGSEISHQRGKRNGTSEHGSTGTKQTTGDESFSRQRAGGQVNSIKSLPSTRSSRSGKTLSERESQSSQ